MASEDIVAAFCVLDWHQRVQEVMMDARVQIGVSVHHDFLHPLVLGWVWVRGPFGSRSGGGGWVCWLVGGILLLLSCIIIIGRYFIIIIGRYFIIIIGRYFIIISGRYFIIIIGRYFTMIIMYYYYSEVFY